MQPLVLNLDTKVNNYDNLDLMQGYDYTLQCNMFDNWVQMDLANVNIQVQLRKADKTFIIQTENITVNKNEITIEIDRDFTRENGKGKIQIVLEKNGKRFGSWVIDAKIKQSAINDNDGQSGNKVTITEALNDKIVEAQETKKDLDISINNGNVAKIRSDLDEVINVDIPKINSSLETKANKDFYEVIFSSITPLAINTEKLQQAIDNGARFIKFPSNCRANMENKILLRNHCKVYGENTTLYKDNANEPFFSNVIPSGSTRIEGVEISKIEFEKKTGLAYHVELIEPYKCKVYKCKFIGNPESDGTYIKTNKSGVFFNKVASDTCFVNYIEKCYFSRASIYMMGTDSYIRNNVIWGYTQEEAIKLKNCSNIDISNNQLVGSSVNGSIYSDITGSACGVSRIVNNFFDGSYEDINSGNGINGLFTLCTIANNTFYNHSANAIRLINPNRNDISNNTFTENNKHGEGKADILFEYTTNTSMMNNVTGNTFNYTRANTSYNCIEEFRNGGTPSVYNQYINNIAPIGVTYGTFNNGQTSGTIDNNKFKSQFISNKTTMDKIFGTLTSSFDNTTITYSISGGCCSIDIVIASGNVVIPSGGNITLCKVLGELYPRYEKNNACVEFDKTSSVRATLTTDGDLKLNNWNATSKGDITVQNLKVTLTYALK